MRSKKQLEAKPCFETVWVTLQEMSRRQKETDRQMKETDRQIKKTELLQRRTERNLEKMYAEARRDMKALQKEIGGISNSNGEMAEEYFYNAFKKHKVFANETYDDIKRNRAYRKNDEIEAEFDIILFNGKSAVLIEVKYNAKPDNISVRKIISRVEAFRLLYPERKDHAIYLGVAAMSFRKGIEQRLHNNGIATIRQIGKKMVVYDQQVKAF
jgi:hypothetical protein